jgi:integrase
MNKAAMTETIMDMIRAADMPAEEIIAALAKRAAKEKAAAKPKPITTQRQAETAAPGLYRAAGAVGLYLNKETVGSGAWSFRFRLGARRRWMGLGPLADVTLLDAQTKATEARLMAKKGIDPIAEKRAIRAATVAKSEPAARIFKTVAEDFVAAHAKAWKRRNAAQLWFSPLARYAFPVIGGLKLNDIRIEHIGAIVDATPAGIASRIVGRIERIISFAIAHGWRDPLLANPAAGKLVKTIRPLKHEGEHYPRIGDLSDAPAIFQRLMKLAETSTPCAAWVLMIACATRPSEALLAEWREFDLDKGLWTIPGGPKGRTKTGKPHVAPLSAPALAILERQAARRMNDSVFPGEFRSCCSYSAFTRAPAKGGIDPASPHSWRSVFADIATDRLGIQPETREACLQHSLGRVTEAYRRETGIEARAVAMERYGAWLTSEDTVVVPLRRA